MPAPPPKPAPLPVSINTTLPYVPMAAAATVCPRTCEYTPGSITCRLSKFTIEGYKFVNITGYNINPDHENIYLTELGNNSYDKHRFPWNLYTVDISLNFIQC